MQYFKKNHFFNSFWRWLVSQANWGKLRNKMLLLVMALTALPFLVFTILGIQKGSSYIYAQTERHNQAQIEQFAHFIDRTFTRQVKAIHEVLTIYLRENLHTPRLIIPLLLKNFSNILMIEIYDPRSRTHVFSRFMQKDFSNRSFPLEEQSVLTHRLDANIEIGEIHYYKEIHESALPVHFSFYNLPEGKRNFEATVYLKFSALMSPLFEWGYSSDAEIVVINQQGDIIIHPRFLPGETRYPRLMETPVREVNSKNPLAENMTVTNDLGDEISRVYAPAPALNCTFILEQNLRSLHHQINRLRLILLTFLAGAFIFSLLGGFWFVSRLVGPLEELEAGIQLLENGLLTEPIPVRSRDEIGHLTNTFNQMAKTLLTRNEEIRAKNRKLSFFIEISRIINQSIELQDILEKSLHKILQLLHASLGWVYVFDHPFKQLRLAFQQGVSNRLASHLKTLPYDNRVSNILLSGRPLLIRNVPQRLNAWPEIIEEQIHSLLIVPLRSKKRTLGVLVIGSFQKDFFHYTDMEMLIRMGDELGIAVENASLYRELQFKLKELEEINKDLQDLDRFKDRILSNVSHELRTPITSIKTYVELFLNNKIGPLDEMQKEKLRIVRRNIDHLLDLINDLLTLARIQNRKVQLKQMELFQLQELIEIVIGDTIEMARAKGLHLKYEGSDTPLILRANRQKLRQVFQNLISNAIKFTEKGEIIIRTRLCPASPTTPSPDDQGREPVDQVEINVIDTGIGIPKKALGKIFQRFYQVDSSSTRKYVGAGLGLAIVKEILEAHESEIQVESRLGQGTRFWFCLPVVKTDHPGKNPLPPHRH